MLPAPPALWTPLNSTVRRRSPPEERFCHLPNQETDTRSCEQDERDGERNLELLRRDKDKRDERDHPDDKSYEVLGEEVGTFTEIVLHVGEACKKVKSV
jgi:hypothetical protein